MKAILGVFGIAFTVVLVAEMLGRRQEIYGGAGGGAVLGLIGLAFAKMIRDRHLESQAPASEGDAPKQGRLDVMGLWGAGMFCRLAVLGGLALLYGRWYEDGIKVPLLATAAVYLVLMFWESVWLMQAFEKRRQARPDEAKNG